MSHKLRPILASCFCCCLLLLVGCQSSSSSSNNNSNSPAGNQNNNQNKTNPGPNSSETNSQADHASYYNQLYRYHFTTPAGWDYIETNSENVLFKSKTTSDKITLTELPNPDNQSVADWLTSSTIEKQANYSLVPTKIGALRFVADNFYPSGKGSTNQLPIVLIRNNGYILKIVPELSDANVYQSFLDSFNLDL
jgi:hypothetical protein